MPVLFQHTFAFRSGRFVVRAIRHHYGVFVFQYLSLHPSYSRSRHTHIFPLTHHNSCLHTASHTRVHLYVDLVMDWDLSGYSALSSHWFFRFLTRCRKQEITLVFACATFAFVHNTMHSPYLLFRSLHNALAFCIDLVEYLYMLVCPLLLFRARFSTRVFCCCMWSCRLTLIVSVLSELLWCIPLWGFWHGGHTHMHMHTRHWTDVHHKHTNALE